MSGRASKRRKILDWGPPITVYFPVRPNTITQESDPTSSSHVPIIRLSSEFFHANFNAAITLGGEFPPQPAWTVEQCTTRAALDCVAHLVEAALSMMGVVWTVGEEAQLLVTATPDPSDDPIPLTAALTREDGRATYPALYLHLPQYGRGG